MERTFNMGIGMLAVLPADQADRAIEVLGQRDVQAWTCGTIRERRDGEAGDAEAKGGVGGAVTLAGTYA